MQDTVVVELSNRMYDSTTKMLKHVITGENATSIELPNEFGQSTLIIDPTLNVSFPNL